MQTMDTPDQADDARLDSPSARRNLGPIVDVLSPLLTPGARVLEVAAGSGQHAAGVVAARPDLCWTPSDPSPRARASIEAWGVGPALALDVLEPAFWPTATVDAVVCINMIHISPWVATEGLMTLAGRVLAPGGLLYLYGPYLEAGVETAASNLAFDADLKARDPAWGLRSVDAVVEAAEANGLSFSRRIAMPAENLSLVFRRV